MPDLSSARQGATGVQQPYSAMVPTDLDTSQTADDAVINPDEQQISARNNSIGNGDAHTESHTETSPLLSNGSPDSSPTTTTSRYIGDITPARFWIIFSQLQLAFFITCFDMTITTSSHPVITSHFHASQLASWLSTVPMLTLTITLPLNGRLSDALGRKPLFVWGLVLFTAATAWCGLATSIKSFIAGRALAGLGAGAAMSMTGIILSDLVKIEYRGSYQAIVNIVYGFASSLGAALGGVMAESLGWRWAFGIQVPPLIASIVIASISIPSDLGLKSGRKSVSQTLREFDSLGAVILALFIAFLILGLNLGGNELPWAHPFIITSLIICVLTAPLFIMVERRAGLPIIPLNIVNTAPRANLLYANFLCSIISNGVLFNMPLYFQAVMLTSATSSGLRLVVPTVVNSVAGAATGFAISYSGRLKWPVTTGPFLYIIGLVSLSLLKRHLPGIIYHLVLVPTFIGQGLQMPGTFMALLGSSTQEEQAVVTGTLMLWRSMGMVLGVALSSLAVQNSLIYYLGKHVVGDEAEKYIKLARSDVAFIRDMPEPYREQVITSYDTALKLTFICGAIAAVVATLTVLPIKVKRLPPKK